MAKRCEIEPPPHTSMRRNRRIFHSPSAGRARMRGRHYRCRTSKTEEQNGGAKWRSKTNLPHPLSISNTYPLSQYHLLKREDNNGCLRCPHNSLTRKNEYYSHIITYKRRLNTVNDCLDLILNNQNEDEIETN